ncbi:hypothetical protein G4B88_028903, partial [Cannabis sativa]
MATLIAMDNASPIEDAEILHKACKGWGTDEKLIINILGHRNATQRKQIREAYERLYEEDLIKRLESELSGDFERAVYRWILDPVDRDAVLAHVAIKKSEVDFKVLIEISCIYSPEELLGVRRAYQNRYKHSLEEDLASHTSEVNARLADSEADIVHKAIKDNCFNNDELIRILTTRSKPQLNATFNRYREDHKTSISKDLLGDSGNSFQKALHTTVRCITDPHKYYAKKMGTDEDSVTRVIVTRAEKDLKEIKEVYYKKNSISLDDAIAKDTSGDYKDFLLALLGKPDH